MAHGDSAAGIAGLRRFRRLSHGTVLAQHQHHNSWCRQSWNEQEGNLRVTLLCVFILVLEAAWSASAAAGPPNDAAPQVIDAAEWEKRVAELERWMAEYKAWSEWIEKWRNRPERSWVGYRERRQRPDPPEWLIDDCAVIVEPTGVLAKGCQMLEDWRTDYSTALVAEQQLKARTQAEKPDHTAWWEHIHLDVLWPMMQSGSSAYGVIGVHATFDVTDRFQMFAAPGAILVNLPAGGRSRDWQPAADWGVAYRLADFTFPGTRRLARLHLNFAKAWILAGESGYKTSINLAGFSVTFRKTP